MVPDSTTSSLLQLTNDIATGFNKAKTTNEHQRQFVETLDHRLYPSKLCRTIKAIDGKSPPKTENEAITFEESQVFSPENIVVVVCHDQVRCQIIQSP